MSEPILQVENIFKYFNIGRNQRVHAIDNISLEVQPSEIFGLVGESGCGKSTLGRVLIHLLKRDSGKIKFLGKEIDHRHKKSVQELRKSMQMIFQDPYSSLNPRMTVLDIISEGPDSMGLWSHNERKKKVEEWLEKVGLHPQHASRYPHEFSGGQRQRIGIARALAVNPKLVICDEPISALDVSVQAQVVRLLKDMQLKQNLTYIFIAHDLSMVQAVCDKIAVMYLGQIIELGEAKEVYGNPQHPYTQALVAANPVPDPVIQKKRKTSSIEGEVPSPVNPKPGCRFAPRCPFVMDKCRSESPKMREIANGRKVACFKV